MKIYVVATNDRHVGLVVRAAFKTKAKAETYIMKLDRQYDCDYECLECELEPKEQDHEEA